MKKIFAILVLLLSQFTVNTYAQGGGSSATTADMEDGNTVVYIKSNTNGAITLGVPEPGIGKNGSKGISVVSVAGAENDWDAQMWVTLPEDETDITTLDWIQNGQDCTKDFDNPNGGTVFGTDAGGANISYVDITDYDAIKVYGPAGQKVRFFINREEFDTNFQFYADIDNNGVGVLDLADVYAAQPGITYIHLNGVKASAYGTTLNLSGITVSSPITAGTKIRIQFDYRASAPVTIGTQSHGEPGNYMHWASIGDVNFTTEWQTWNKVLTVPNEADGMKSIAFNLSKDKYNDVTFYIDNVKAFYGDQPSNTSGTCQWAIDDNGQLTIRPTNGVSGTLGDWGYGQAPWYGQRENIMAAKVEAGVDAASCKHLFDGCSSLLEVWWEPNVIPADAIGTGTAANMIIYAPEGTKTELDYNVVIGGKCDYLKLTEGEALSISQEFEAEYAMLTRTFSKPTLVEQSAGWESIVVPFDVTSIIDEQDRPLAPFGSDKSGTHPFWLAQMTPGGNFTYCTEMKANTPYLISMPNSPLYIDEFNITGEVQFIGENVTVKKTDDAQAIEGASLQIVPTYIETTNNAGEPEDESEYPKLSNADFAEGVVGDVNIATYEKDGNPNRMQEVPGWNFGVENGDARAAGVVAYGSGTTLGGSVHTVPAAGPEGTNGNALALVGVWAGTVQYIQNVTLPAGKYTMTVPVYNTAGTQAFVKNLIGVKIGETENYAATTSYAVGQWTNETVFFELAEKTEVTVSLGYEGANAGSGASQHLFLDCVKIEAYDELAGAKTAAIANTPADDSFTAHKAKSNFIPGGLYALNREAFTDDELNEYPAGSVFVSDNTSVALPFEFYVMPKSAPVKGQYIPINIDNAADQLQRLYADTYGTLRIHSENHGLVIQATTPQTIGVYNAQGILVCTLRLHPGENRTPQLPAGLYVVGKEKYMVK